MATGLVLGLSGFLLYFVAVAVLLRLARGVGPVLIVLGSVVPVGIVALALFLGLGQRVNFWMYVAGYCFFVLSFLMAFGAIYKSISLRILLDLARKPERTDTYENVLRRYIAEESFHDRLAVIERQQFATRLGDGFVLTQRGWRVAKSLQSIQKFYRIARSG
jgi:hypothetical protein